uniref:Putative ca2+ sensor ef-hand superfamily n=1 Tax=Lutzomyia longipalpis TaxID=7200 RepID=A0A7G3ACR1_LUTLO
MAYSWDNRVDFVVRFMYDIDNNGFLDDNDFQCMAVRAAVIEGKGNVNDGRLGEYRHIMKSLWEEISDLADDDKDGKISTEEFKGAVKKTCVGKPYDGFPQAMKAFIEANFKMIDLNSDGVINLEEYRYNCITRIAVDDIKVVDEAYNRLLNAMKAFIEANFKMIDLNSDGVINLEEYRYNCITRIAVDDIKVVDEAYNRLLNDDDRKRGGLTLARYQELYSHYLGGTDEKNPGVTLFGPLTN